MRCKTCTGARTVNCSECKGEGLGLGHQKCTNCEGTGMVPCEGCDGRGKISFMKWLRGK